MTTVAEKGKCNHITNVEHKDCFHKKSEATRQLSTTGKWLVENRAGHLKLFDEQELYWFGRSHHLGKQEATDDQ